jgi:hypothetical protein
MAQRGFWQRSFEENVEMLGDHAPLLVIVVGVCVWMGSIALSGIRARCSLPRATRILEPVEAGKSALRQHFEVERRRAAFLAFLPATGAGIIASDTWITPWMGIPGGLLFGGAAYLLVYGYETLIWRRDHGN